MSLQYLAIAAVIVSLSAHGCGEIRVLSVVSAAGFESGWLMGGGLATVFCTGLTGIEGIVIAGEFPLPRTLAGVSVETGTLRAPILAVADLGGYQQINIQVPWQVPRVQNLVVTQGGFRSPVFNAGELLHWPAFFKTDDGMLIAQHAATWDLVTRANPVRPGEWIVAYATNLGAVSNTPEDGMPARSDPLSLLPGALGGYPRRLAVKAAGHDITLQPAYVGLVPGAVGLYQINFQMPDIGGGTANLVFENNVFCGFFWTPGCGRGWVKVVSAAALPVAP